MSNPNIPHYGNLNPNQKAEKVNFEEIIKNSEGKITQEMSIEPNILFEEEKIEITNEYFAIFDHNNQKIIYDCIGNDFSEVYKEIGQVCSYFVQ